MQSHAHMLVHTSQSWEVQLIIPLFIKNQLLFTIVPGISNHGLEQLTSVTHFDEQNFCNRNFVEIRQNTNSTPSHPCHSLGVQNATFVVLYSQEGLKTRHLIMALCEAETLA